APQEFFTTESGRVADAVDGRQRERPQYRRVGGKDGRNVDRPGCLPGEMLALPAVEFSRPSHDAEEPQPNSSMFIVIVARQPWIGALDFDSELFMQFALEPAEWVLARFTLAAGELPVAGIDLARGPLTQEE